MLTGNFLSYSITVYNNGPGYVPDILVYDTMPPGVVFYSGSNCDYFGSPDFKVICNSDGLVSHQSELFSFVVITPDYAGKITNTAYATGYAYDPRPDNNMGIAYTTVVYELPASIYLPLVVR